MLHCSLEIYLNVLQLVLDVNPEFLAQFFRQAVDPRDTCVSRTHHVTATSSARAIVLLLRHNLDLARVDGDVILRAPCCAVWSVVRVRHPSHDLVRSTRARQEAGKLAVPLRVAFAADCK